MLKSKFYYSLSVVAAVIICAGFFTSCTDPSNSGNNENPPEKTWVEFKNLEQFPVSIYSDPARQVVFAEIPANGTKKVAAEPAPVGKAFYPTFKLIYPISTTSITIPYNAPSISVAILADETNTASIPKLESIVINSAYVMLINESSFSLSFNEGNSEKIPLGGGSSLINSGKNAAYEITPGSVSKYSVLRNASTPIAYPAELTEFKASIIYVLTNNGTSLILAYQISVDTVIISGSNLSEKLAWLQNNSESNSSYFIEITANENIVPQNLSYSGKSGITIRLNGGGVMRIVNLSGNGNLFTIGSGVTLILDDNITLNGSGNNSSLVGIDSGGTLVMNAGAKITGNYSTNSSYGGGVYNSGTFFMNGGEISGNTSSSSSSTPYTYNSCGGGVYNIGIFTMNGGEISGNTSRASNSSTTTTSPSSYGGGVYNIGIFTMNGGKIFGNNSNASSLYYNSYSSGGGVYNIGTFTMNGGEISGNTSSASSTSSYAYAYSYGGGVYSGYSNSTFHMSSGVIYGNNAQADLKNSASWGVALYSNSGTTQYGTFSGNTFYRSGDLVTTDTTIRIVNGVLLTE